MHLNLMSIQKVLGNGMKFRIDYDLHTHEPFFFFFSVQYFSNYIETDRLVRTGKNVSAAAWGSRPN